MHRISGKEVALALFGEDVEGVHAVDARPVVRVGPAGQQQLHHLHVTCLYRHQQPRPAHPPYKLEYLLIYLI